jgi:hypothetical protein
VTTGEFDGDDAIVEIGGLRVAPGDRIGNYVYRRPIGRGGMAHVLLASDPDGRPIALKVLKSDRVGSGYQRFMREFKALARLRHPNVIRVDALGSIHGHPFIAMEYVDGHDLHHAIHTFRLLRAEERWRRCEEVLVDLCRALAHIHRRGLIHRDLKPSNVLLDHDRHCKLTDFGIVKDLDPEADSHISTTLVGTWAYASPEQIQGAPIDHRSDLYSLGVILYAMLTGRRPFVAKDLAGYVELHRTHTLPTLEPIVPAHLVEICHRLLQKHPKDRYRSAQEVLYRLEQLEVDLDVPEAPWEPPLLGRATEEEEIRGRVAALTRREPGAIWLEGGEGTGKTRLLEVADHQARVMGLPVHRLAPTAQDGAFGLILRFARSIADLLPARRDGPLRAALAAQEGAVDAARAREQLLLGLAQALEQLLEDGPQVLILEDLHLALLPTVDAVTWLYRRFVQEGNRGALLLVGAWRPDRMGARLAALRDTSTANGATLLHLGPLAPAAVDDLVLSLLGPGRTTEVLSARLQHETEGNPAFLAAYIRALMARGGLVRSAGGWRVTMDADELATGHLEIPAPVRAAVNARLTECGERDRPLLDALAVTGRELDLDLLLEILDLDEESALDSLEALENAGVVRQRRAGQEVFYDLAHPRYGDVLYRDMDIERRSALHRAVATALEARYQHAPAAAEAVGEHWRRAGEAGKALHYLAAAARRARDRGQYGAAWDLTSRAQGVEDVAKVDLPGSTFNGLRHIVLQVRADVLFHRTEWREARAVLEEALSLLGPGVDEASALRTRIHHGRLLRVLGDLDRAEEQIRACVGRARELRDREAVAESLLVLAGVAWGRGRLDECEQLAQEGLLLATGPGLAGSRAHLLLALTAVQGSRGQLASAASGLLEAQALLGTLQMRSARALALANLAEVVLGQGDTATAWEYATDALQEAEAVGHRLGEAAARGIRGLAATRAGVYEEARVELAAAVAAARALGVQSELAVPTWQLARLDLEEGDLESALAHLDTAAAAARLGDPERYSPAIDVLRAQVHACTDSADAALTLLARVDAELPALPALRRVQVLLDLAETRRLLGDPALATHLAQEAEQVAAMGGFRLYQLDAVHLLARLSDDPRARAAEQSRIRELANDLAGSMPAAWRATFLQRLGLRA